MDSCLPCRLTSQLEFGASLAVLVLHYFEILLAFVVEIFCQLRKKIISELVLPKEFLFHITLISLC